MTKDDIISIAREVWGDDSGKPWSQSALLHIERFAELLEAKVRAEEREQCAKAAEETVCDMHLPTGVKIYGTRAAKAIRARGEK